MDTSRRCARRARRDVHRRAGRRRASSHQSSTTPASRRAAATASRGGWRSSRTAPLRRRLADADAAGVGRLRRPLARRRHAVQRRRRPSAADASSTPRTPLLDEHRHGAGRARRRRRPAPDRADGRRRSNASPLTGGRVDLPVLLEHPARRPRARPRRRDDDVPVARRAGGGARCSACPSTTRSAATIFLGVPEHQRHQAAPRARRVVRHDRPLRRPAVLTVISLLKTRRLDRIVVDDAASGPDAITGPSRIAAGGGRRSTAPVAGRIAVQMGTSARCGRSAGPRRRSVAGCSKAAKWPPASSSFQWRMSVKRRSAQRRDGRKISLGKIDMPDGTSIVSRRAEAVEALPVQPGRRGPGAGQPVVHHVVEQAVAGDSVLRVAAVVGPRPELLDDPRRLRRRRVDEPVAERLRARRLLRRVPRAPLAVLVSGPAPPARPRSARRGPCPGRPTPC